jgi:predicted outer membrane repeat protein
MRSDRLLASSLAALAVASAAHSQVHVYVDDDAPDGGNGLSWDSAMNDLHLAIDIAHKLGEYRGEIRIAGGTYRPERTVPFQIPATELGQPAFTLFGGYAGLDRPLSPDTRDADLFQTVLDADINNDDAAGGLADNAIDLLVIDGSSASETPLSGVVLEGLKFRGAANTAVSVSDSSAAISDCTFSKNTGTAIYIYDSPAFIEACSFVENTGASGSAIFAHGGAVEIQFSEFLENTSTTQGGAVYVERTQLRVAESSFIQNAAEDGGAIYIRSDGGIIEDCVFEINSATDEGGAVCADRDLDLRDSVFTMNTAEKGGAVMGKGHFFGCRFAENAAQSDSELRVRGGAIYANGFATMAECEFARNTAYEGGGVYVWPNYYNVTLDGCVFEENTATAHGGGAYGARYIRGSSFLNNSSEGSGGGVFNAGDISGSQIVGNSAGYGGGIYNAKTIVSCVIENNHALLGGGIYIPRQEAMVVTDSILYNNSSTSFGSAIRSQGNFDLIRSTVTQADPYEYSSLIAFGEGVGWIESSIIWDRRLDGFPAIELQPNASLAVLYSNLRLDPVYITVHISAELNILGDNYGSDPKFMDIAAGDLGLQSGSICIDAGLLLHESELPDQDAIGNPREARDDAGTPNTGFGEMDYLDIGALEFQGTSCLADVNNDGELTATDFTAWIAAYNSGNPAADQNRDGIINQGDFTAWINNYTNGCG